MTGPVLYSTNVSLKFLIQETYRKQIHYVWCSEIFDSRSAARYTLASHVPASSNPHDIYRELKRDVESRDRHSAKITAQKASLTKLAVQWEAVGELTHVEMQDIVYNIEHADFHVWRPLLYVIPRSLVEARLKLVPADRRAGFGPEYIVEDLQRAEFDVIEF
jgi:hypothetical protein